jgi:hypothetical protein
MQCAKRSRRTCGCFSSAPGILATMPDVFHRTCISIQPDPCFHAVALDRVLRCHPLYWFAAATSSVWIFQINDPPMQWTPPIQNVYRGVADG